MAIVKVMQPFFEFCGPSCVFGTGEARHYKFNLMIDTDTYKCMCPRVPLKECVQGHVTSLDLKNN